MVDTERKYGLDVIKIIATILIVFHHYQQITGVVFDGINFIGGAFSFGYIVELFFIISGYVIYPYIDKISEKSIRLSEFYFNRFIRLFPMVTITAIAYEVLLYIYVCRMGQEWFGGLQPTLWGTVIDCLMIQCGWGFANPAVNNPTWYVSILMLCYVLFFIIVSIAKRYKFDVIYLFIIMILLGVSVHTYSLEVPILNSDTYRGFYSFFWGLILRRFMPVIQKKIIQHKFSLAFLGTILLIIPFLIHKEHVVVSQDINYVVTFLYYTIIICIFEMPCISRLFKCSFLKTLCEISFNVYLWHLTLLIAMYIIIAVIWGGQTWFLGSYKTMYLFTIVNFVWGSMSYYLVEKPIVLHISAKKQG